MDRGDRRPRRRRGRGGAQPGHRGTARRGAVRLAGAGRRRRGDGQGGAGRVAADPGRGAGRAAARCRRLAPRPHRGAGPADDAGGRQAAGGEHRRGRLDRQRLRLLRRARPSRARPGDPVDRGRPARAGAQGAGRGGGRDRALELPSAPAGLEARAGPGGRQRRGRQALAVHAAVDAAAGRGVRRLPGRGGEPARRRRGRRRGAGGAPRHRHGRVHRLGRHRAADRRALRRAGQAGPPGARRQGRVHRLRRRRPRGRRARRGMGRLPERRPTRLAHYRAVRPDHLRDPVVW